MLHFLADENFNHHIVVGLRRRNPAIDIVRIQDIGLVGAKDETVLTWAAEAKRIILTHDAATMPDLAYQRQALGHVTSGIFVVGWRLAYGVAIDDITLLAECSTQEEWQGRVLYLPLR